MYEHSKIYKLQCNDGSFYIGSTTTELRKRFNHHKGLSKKRNSTVYSHINTIGWDNVQIILIEEFSCKNKDQLRQKEDEHIQRELNNELCLNSQRAFTSDEEKKQYYKNWIIQNKEQTKDYQKQYQEQNKEKLKEQKKQYYEKNKEKLKEYQKQHRMKQKAKQDQTDLEISS